jgi:hypothetical protein
MRSLLGRFHRPFARGVDEQLLLLNNLGDGSTLSLDFTTGVLDPRLTFTRSTTGTYINSSGYVTSAAIDAPRFDYNPTTTPPTPRGLLIEASAVNYMLESSSLTGYSNAGMAAVTAGSETDPTGTANSARQIYATAGGTFHGYYRTITAGTNTQITVSIWAKARTYTHLFLSDLASGRAAVRFNLSTGATDNNSGAGYVSAKATSFPNNWWRCEMVVNVTASTSYGWTFVGVPSSGATLNNFGAQYTGTGNAADGIYCYGFQVEAGPAATSYIATTSSTVTRAVDSCVMTGTNFSSWFNATEGTLLAHAIRSRTSDIGRIASVNDNTANESIELAADATGEFIVVDGGSTLANITPGTVTANTAFKIAGAYKLNDVQAALGGTLGVADTAVTMPTVDRLMIGQQAGASPIYLNGTIALLKYWPTRLTNAQLQSLTT